METGQPTMKTPSIAAYKQFKLANLLQNPRPHVGEENTRLAALQKLDSMMLTVNHPGIGQVVFLKRENRECGSIRPPVVSSADREEEQLRASCTSSRANLE